MNYRTLFCTFVLAVIAPAIVAMAEEKTSSAAAQFEQLKKLAGDWVAVKDGKPGEAVATSIRITSGGTAIEETIFPGTPKEMVTMYHLDGQDLVLTHYCMLGNQPTMRAEPSSDPGRVAFKFVRAGNLKSEGEQHMDHVTLTILGPDHYRAEWTACQDGKDCHVENLDFVRKHK